MKSVTYCFQIALGREQIRYQKMPTTEIKKKVSTKFNISSSGRSENEQERYQMSYVIRGKKKLTLSNPLSIFSASTASDTNRRKYKKYPTVKISFAFSFPSPVNDLHKQTQQPSETALHNYTRHNKKLSKSLGRSGLHAELQNDSEFELQSCHDIHFQL